MGDDGPSLDIDDRNANDTPGWKKDEGEAAEARTAGLPNDEALAHAIEETSTDWTPWFTVPADRKWFRNLAITEGSRADPREDEHRAP